MAKTYTIDEAAERLGVPLEEFKRRWKTEWTTVRTFRDGGTVRFRTADIDELARTLGMASDPGSQLAPPTQDHSSTEYLLPDESAVGDDIFTTDSDSSRRNSGRPADSDIRLEADAGPKSNRRRGAQESTPTEELSIDLAMPPSGVKKKTGNSSSKLSAPKTGPNLSKSSSNLKKDSDSSSEFELSLDSDSDSFELNVNPDGSDEVDLGGTQVGKRGGQSGINLARPADSGVSLEQDSDDELELSLGDEPTTDSGRRLSGPKSVKMPQMSSDSDSEFELTLDDNSDSMEALAAEEGQGDIFETDFELPADDADSGSEVVAVENSDTDLENSDFDLALDESDIQADDESASQVVLLDDDDSDEQRSGRLGVSSRRSPADDDDAIDLEDEDASSQLRNVPRRRRDEDDEDDVVPSGAVAKPKPWGALPAAVLLPAFILTFLGGLMSYELVRGMWSYNTGSKPGGTLVRTVADWFDMKPMD